jgi:hypothetical protein
MIKDILFHSLSNVLDQTPIMLNILNQTPGFLISEEKSLFKLSFCEEQQTSPSIFFACQAIQFDHTLLLITVSSSMLKITKTLFS